MVSEANRVMLSVRGDARRSVAPDYAIVRTAVEATADTKAAALELVAAAQQRVIGALGALGGVPLTAESERAALTWSAHSLHSYEEHSKQGPTNRIVAQLEFTIQVRNLQRFEDVSAALARVEELDVQHVSWQVAADNPQWRPVRAAAIRAAIAKAHDYAAALGGSLERVEHIADTGLLGGDNHAQEQSGRGAMFSMGAAAGGSPSLDPVPQELVAIIEARFVASIAPLS